MSRRAPLTNDEIYHVTNRSIAGYVIFPTDYDYIRFIRLLRFFSIAKHTTKFSFFLNRNSDVIRQGFESSIHESITKSERIVQILAYCIMPTHFHLLLKQLSNNGIAELLCNIENSYARYFNVKYKRQGHLWEGPFKNVLIENDNQLLHVSRYIHLNSTSAGLTRNPDEWPYSSYKEYIDPSSVEWPVTQHSDYISMRSPEYKRFCEDQASYQRSLQIIKRELLLE